MKCRICDMPMQPYDEIDGCSIGHTKLGDVPFIKATKKIKLWSCENCSHIQAENTLANDFYDNYDMFETDEIMYYGEFKDINAKRLCKLRSFARSNDSFLDIGCGRGDLLKAGASLFQTCIGVEPSEIECQRARQSGFEVINSYFNESCKFDRQFTTFASTMVFEHLERPLETIKSAYNILSDRGCGLINVPNGQLITSMHMYDQIISEHINYFTPLSLAYLAEKAGFDIIGVDVLDDILELDIYIRKSVRNNKSISECKEEQKSILADMLKKNKVITIWGAGNKANKYSALLSKDIKICHVIDSSKSKQGKYVSGIDIPIEIASKEIIKQSDAIIIFATTYKDEIVNDLQHKYNYHGRIIFFDADTVKYIDQ